MRGKDGKNEFVFDVDHCKRSVKKSKMSVNIFWNDVMSGEKCQILRDQLVYFIKKIGECFYLNIKVA